LDADVPVDRISALPDELRQCILTRLTYKDAIRTGVLARGWRDLWRSRWAQRASVEVHLRTRDSSRKELDALEREPRPRRRVDFFSFVAEIVGDNHKGPLITGEIPLFLKNNKT
jgi:hypothetical protein